LKYIICKASRKVEDTKGNQKP